MLRAVERAPLHRERAALYVDSDARRAREARRRWRGRARRRRCRRRRRRRRSRRRPRLDKLLQLGVVHVDQRVELRRPFAEGWVSSTSPPSVARSPTASAFVAQVRRAPTPGSAAGSGLPVPATALGLAPRLLLLAREQLLVVARPHVLLERGGERLERFVMNFSFTRCMIVSSSSSPPSSFRSSSSSQSSISSIAELSFRRSPSSSVIRYSNSPPRSTCRLKASRGCPRPCGELRRHVPAEGDGV